MIDRLDDDLVGENVELLLRLSLNVLEVSSAKYVSQSGAAHLVGDHLRSQRQIVEYSGKLTGSFRV